MNKIRLTSSQTEGLIQALTPFIEKGSAELRLYGSRVDPNAKGGDIDLLLLTTDEQTQQHLSSQKHYLLSAIKKAIGEQKIDLLIRCKTSTKEDPFFDLIYPGSALLHLF